MDAPGEDTTPTRSSFRVGASSTRHTGDPNADSNPYAQAASAPGQAASPTTPPYTYPYPSQGQPLVTNQKAILSLVLGAVALFVPIPYVLGIIAIVMGNQARPEIQADANQTGDGLALAGIILGWVDIALSTVMVLIWIMFLGAFGRMGGF